MTSTATAPDAVGYKTTWRAWVVSSNPEIQSWVIYSDPVSQYRLKSLSMNYTWHLGIKQYQATCEARFKAHPAKTTPNENCRCGFYSLNTLENLLREPTVVNGLRTPIPQKAEVHRIYVCGEVKAWGKILNYSYGIKSEFVELSSLYAIPLMENRERVSTDIIGRLASIYDVPLIQSPENDIILQQWRDGAITAYPSLGAKLATGTITASKITAGPLKII